MSNVPSHIFTSALSPHSPALVVPLPPMSAEAVAAVRRLEEAALKQPQVDIPTAHAFHAGMSPAPSPFPPGWC